MLVLSENFTISLQANVSGETKPRDEFNGAKAADTGITSVFLGPEILFTWRDKLSAEFGVDVPVSVDNTALQIVPDYRLRAAVTWHF
jgi:long-subunit fatty acid transport protein